MGVEGGAVRGDPAGSPPGGVEHPGVGRPAWGASAHGAAGVGQRGPAGAEDAGAVGAAAGCVQAGDRRDAARGSGCAAQAAAYRQAGAGPAGRRARRRGSCRTRRCGTTSPGAARRSLCEAGRALEEGFVPQTHEPGAEAEVDFADLWVDLAGVRTKVSLFTLRLSYSGKAVHRVFPTQGQEAFLEGHVHAFDGVGRGAGGQDPLRQPQGRGVAGDVRAHPHRVRPVGGVPLALRVRRVLLPARRRGRAREGRRGGRGRPVPPHPPGPGARGVVAGRAQRPPRGLRRRRRPPPDQQPDDERRA